MGDIEGLVIGVIIEDCLRRFMGVGRNMGNMGDCVGESDVYGMEYLC